MPQIATISAYKHDGVTSASYTGIQPSSGDNSPAIWQDVTVGSAPAHHPEFRLVAREGMKGARRVLRGTFQYPVIATNASTGLTSVVDKISGDVNFMFPKTVSQDAINEAAQQMAYIIASSLIRSCLKAGYSAT